MNEPVTGDQDRTRWFCKKPDGDTYYGRIYHGRTYELIPVTPPRITFKGAGPYFEDGPLDLYPGAFLADSDANTVFADEGASKLKYVGGSGNLGGYVEMYYLAELGDLSVELKADGNAVTIALDKMLLKHFPDSDTVRKLISFIATAKACSSYNGLNLRHRDYRDKIDSTAPLMVDYPVHVWVEFGTVHIHLRDQI